MRRFCALLLLAACASEPEPAQDPGKMDDPHRPFTMGSRAIDQNILQIPPYETFTDPETGRTFIIRFYAMHNPGHDNEVMIITVDDGGERMATMDEWWRARALWQEKITEEGDRQHRLLRAWFRGDQIRKDTALKERIRFKKGEVEDLENEVSRLQRTIRATEEIPIEKKEDDKQVEAMMRFLAARAAQLKLARAELAYLQYMDALREQEIAQLKPPFHKADPVPLPIEQNPPPPR
jgi:hypothetical protein